jgi:hypothetical protein
MLSRSSFSQLNLRFQSTGWRHVVQIADAMAFIILLIFDTERCSLRSTERFRVRGVSESWRFSFSRLQKLPSAAFVYGGYLDGNCVFEPPRPFSRAAFVK